MSSCCICGKKIGGFGEEKLEIERNIFVCYRCVNLLKELKISRSPEEYEQKLETIENKISVHNAPDNEKKAIKQYLVKIKSEKAYADRKEMAEKILPKLRDGMLITTGYNFEGFRIKQYLNIVHGDVVLGTGFLSELSRSVSDMVGGQSGSMEGKFSKAKSLAQDEMLKNAYAKGANAIIGIDFDISTLMDNVVAVSANGTAVVIEKE